MLPTVEDITKYGLLVENPLWKLKQYKQGKLAPRHMPVVQECPQCHLYTEGVKHPMCSNCGTKLKN